jgi:hypothetical protein
MSAATMPKVISTESIAEPIRTALMTDSAGRAFWLRSMGARARPAPEGGPDAALLPLFMRAR